MIKFEKPAKKGFDASIEVGCTLFLLKNINEIKTGHTHIDISDENGKFIDEFASGFGIDFNDDAETLEYNAIKVFEYIDENLVF